MKFSERWLREWVNPPIDINRLAAQLTTVGLEVDSVESIGGPINNVFVAEVIDFEPHPRAEKLSLCQIRVDDGDLRQVVCGAPNIRKGLRSAFADVGATLPAGTEVRRLKIRGVSSHGMLCSARELGMGEAHEGIIELPGDAPVGMDISRFLSLGDHLIEIDLTPNRGECLGIAGLAREVGAINKCRVAGPTIDPIPSAIEDSLPITLEAPLDCPRYVGRVIRNIDPARKTPIWLVEKLRRSGIRSISPVVDVTNYVMIELGQPMHAFDLDQLEGGICVRRATVGETLILLDGQRVELDSTALVIADRRRALALAGVMGGIDSGVGERTTNIFLESAFFTPDTLIGKARRYGLHTDASHRFERGVDPQLQRRAAERASSLLLEIVGGKPGPIVDEMSVINMPQRKAIKLRPSRIRRLLGEDIEKAVVTDVLERLGMQISSNEWGWEVVPPSYRFDITMEADLIEEIARMVGYEQISVVSLGAFPAPSCKLEADVEFRDLCQILVHYGYHEIITYSFVSPKLQQWMDPEHSPIALSNPLSSDLSMMRTSLWPGLLQTLEYNLNRQQECVRLFESGLTFVHQGEALKQIKHLAGLATGPAMDKQWGDERCAVDLYDMKGEVEALFSLTRSTDQFEFTPDTHPALHPGQTARITRAGDHIGWLGLLHPRLSNQLKCQTAIYLFEVQVEAATSGLSTAL